jgi:hypothetical protein
VIEVARTEEQTHIYGEVDSATDVRTINTQIRKEMDSVKSREQLTELKKRSDYLCTLAEAPSWKTKFGAQIHEIQRATRDEDRKTTEHANGIARRHGWDADYHPWGAH